MNSSPGHAAVGNRQPTDTPSAESDREKALREAEQCLALLQQEDFLLDGFNLLGIVANPGGTSHQNSQHPPRPASASASTAPSANQQKQQQQHQPTGSDTVVNGQTATPSSAATAPAPVAAGGGTPAAAESAESAPSYYTAYFSGTVQSLEQTLGQVTEQIDTLNMFLEELSKEYLGEYGDETTNIEYYLSQEEEAEDIDVSTVPKELVNTVRKGDTVKAYLAQSGKLADSLKHTELRPSPHVLPNPEMPHIAMATAALEQAAQDNDGTTTAEKVEALLKQLPPAIIDADFDLTDPVTFATLIIGDSLDNASEVKGIASFSKRQMNAKESLLQPTSELVPAANPDKLTQHLDRVELALMEQVREKSGAFFQETTRFRQLSTNVVDLLGQTSRLRRVVQSVVDSYKGVSNIPALDEARDRLDALHDVLQSVVELLNVKSSIGGLVSANDHFSAAEQIQYGQKLLLGTIVDAAGSSNDKTDKPAEAKRLDQLNALQSCGEQFRQYQSLVVQNLSDELTEAFLNWKRPRASRGLPEDTVRVLDMMRALKMCDSLDVAGQVYVKRIRQTLRMTKQTTIAEFVDSIKNDGGKPNSSVTGMTYDSFYRCLNLLLEELLAILLTAKSVDEFCVSQQVFGPDKASLIDSTTTNGEQVGSATTNGELSGSPLPSSAADKEVRRWTEDAVCTCVEMASEDIAQILRMRKEAHSLISLNDMRQLWDRCINFVSRIEHLSTARASGLKSTLVGQARAFLERTHETNMSSLAVALDSERWTQSEVSAERQEALTRLCSGRAVVSNTNRRRGQDDMASNPTTAGSTAARRPMAVVEGTSYKVVWSCLLLVEMIMTNLSAAAHFQSLATNAVGKVAELMRLFNARTTQLVLGAGAIHSAARLKSINAKHLSLVTQSLGMMLALFPHIRAALMAQLLPKQHALLKDLDAIKSAYIEHNEQVMNKFVTIIGGLVEHSLAPRISSTDFDARGRDLPTPNGDGSPVACCVFFDGVVTNTKKMHQILSNLLPPDHLQDVFSRIFAYVDEKIPALLIAADSASNTVQAKNGKASAPGFSFPQTDVGRHRLLMELQHVTASLNGLPGVLQWDFGAIGTIERRIDYQLVKDPKGDVDDVGDGEVDVKSTEDIPSPGRVPMESKDEDTSEPSAEDDTTEDHADSAGDKNGNAQSNGSEHPVSADEATVGNEKENEDNPIGSADDEKGIASGIE